MITDPDHYFRSGCGRCDRFDTPDCSTRRWESGLLALRDICLDEGLTETAKWGHPCYMHGDRNVTLFGAFRTDFRLSFFDASLLEDTERVLEPAGPNSQHASVLRFTDSAQVAERAPAIRDLIRELKGYIDAGIRPEKRAVEVELPSELVDALDADPELAEAFQALTPGRQRSYVIHLNSAKKSETRISRIEKSREKILAGKGATER